MSETDSTGDVTLVGALLKQRRREKGAAIDELAAELNLRPAQLSAIEDNDFDSLPGDTFARGYIRGYARWAELDEDAAIAQYLKQTGGSEALRSLEEVRPTTEKPYRMPAERKIFPIGAALLVSFLIFGFWLFSQFGSDPAPTSGSTEIAVDTFSGKPLSKQHDIFAEKLAREQRESQAQRPNASIAQSEASGSSPGESLDAAVESSASVTEVETALVPSSTLTSSNESDVTDESTAVQGESPDASLPIRETEAIVGEAVVLDSGSREIGEGPDELWFAFSDDCWVEVVDAQQERLVSEVSKSGDWLSVRGTAPFKVVVGKADAVTTLLFNSELVTIVSSGRQQSARLTLGG